MVKINGNEIRPNMVISHNGGVWRAVKCNHVKPGKGGAFNQVEMRNLFTGSKTNERFRANETVERVRLEQRSYQYLFASDQVFTFMNQENFEQIELHREFIGASGDFLQDGMMVEIDFYEDKPIGIKIPEQVVLKVEETEPAMKGQTATSSFKPAICENGIRINVPPFVNVGDRIIVQTGERTYLSRAD